MDNREIDQLVAEKIFGWRWYSQRGKARRNSSGERVFWFGPPDKSLPPHWKNVVEDRPTGDTKELLCYMPHPPHYTTDPAADYSVLVNVRETWDEPMQDKWHVALQNVWMDRRGGPMLIAFTAIDYLPGDFSKAALAALGIEVEG